MPSPNDVQFNPPENWDAFEAICADLFALEWDYPEAVRYGRTGQRQNGVDIYGKEHGDDVGAQCKGKRNWPPTKLTTAEIDDEVAKARGFNPKLKKYFIVTTADNDVRLIDHANAITARHAVTGEFSVHVYGWGELIRRIRKYPEILNTHFGVYTLQKVRDDIRAVPNAVIGGVMDLLQPVMAAVADDAARREILAPKPALDESLGQALECYYDDRYRTILKRSMFPEVNDGDEFTPLAREILESAGTALSSSLRRTIFLRASRWTALRNKLADAGLFLAEAEKLVGPESDKPTRARLAVARGDAQHAIQLLRDESDADSQSVLFDILAASQGDDRALAWFKESSIPVAAFTSTGIMTICQIHLRRGDMAAVGDVLASLSQEQLDGAPYFYFFRGAVRFSLVLPRPEQQLALLGLPLSVRLARPILPDAELALQLDNASNDLRQALPQATALGLRDAPQLIETYLLWADLLHPARQAEALMQLKRDMLEFARALPRVQFAFAYDPEFKSDALEEYLKRRADFGGLSKDEFRAALSVQLNKDNAEGVVTLIGQNRNLAEANFGKSAVCALEVQGLAKKGDATSARMVLEANLESFDAHLLASLQTEIAKAEGADPVVEHLRLYEATKGTEALRALVGALAQKKDHKSVARYAQLLYAETNDRRDMAAAAQALIFAGETDEFLRVYEANSYLSDLDDNFLRHYGWQLFRLGRQSEAKEAADTLAKKKSDDRDLALEIAIAIETGEWETLAEPIAAYLEQADVYRSIDLIRAAHLAQAWGHGPILDLIDAAVKKDDQDANVLLGAYTLHVEEGLEEKRPEAQMWFRKALALSGPDGPIQSFELKDLLARQTEWNERTRKISDQVSRAEMPLFVAGTGLRTTLVDVVLRNLIRNTGLADGRRRTAIPLFAGVRLPAPFGNAKTAAFDITSLLVLGWLGILPKAIDAFPQVIIPAGALNELFEGRRRIRQFQRSRLQQAEAVRDAIAAGKLKIIRTVGLARDALSELVGTELATLLREAKAAEGVVLRPAPVHELGLENRDADLSAYQDRLTDMHTLLSTLSDLNVVDEATEVSAKQYFSLQDKAWPTPARIDVSKPIYVDGLALVYLQYTGLWTPFLLTFPHVYIHASTEEEAMVLIEYDKSVDEVLHVIDGIRNAVRKANAAKQIRFGARRAANNEREEGIGFSTMNLLSHLGGADVVICDDRYLNKQPFMEDPTTHRTAIASTLDLIEELRVRGILTEDERRALRYQLRAAGGMLVPVDADELAAAVKRNRQNEAPEFRAIRDSLDLARLAEMPQFPGEMRWFISFIHATKNAIARIWNEEDSQRAEKISDTLLRFHPLPEDWVGRWNGNPPPGWVPAVRRAFIGGFALPFGIDDQAKIDAYQKWFEEARSAELRQLAPETYREIVTYLSEFIQIPWGNGDEKSGRRR